MSIVERPSLECAARVPTLDVTRWVMQISAGMVFLVVGLAKFQSESYWVGLFTDIGLGDWFRYLTGALQVAGGRCSSSREQFQPPPCSPEAR